MFPLSPSLWIAVGAALLIAGLGIAVKVQTSRLDAVRTEYATFKAEVKVLGEAAQKQADARTAADKLNKEKTDAKHKKAVSDLAATVARLRDERSGSSFLPAPAPNTASPEVATFDRTLLERAIRTLDQDIQGFVDEGSKAVIDLNAAKEWAK